MKDPIDELEQLQQKSAAPLVASLVRVGLAVLRGSVRDLARSRVVLARQITNVSAAADLLGRRRLFLEVKAKVGGRKFAVEQDVPFLPAVPFQEAIDDLLKREPRLAPGWEEAQKVYAEGGFAAARAASENVAQRIQSILGDVLAKGTPAGEAKRRIVEALESGKKDALFAGIDPGGWTRAYADVIFRTNTSSAYSAGRKRQAQDPAVREVIGGWRYQATRDVAVRPNHKAMHNVVAHLDDPIWNSLFPPLGYQCRCSPEMVTVDEMRELGLIGPKGGVTRKASVPSGASRDVGFRAVAVYPR